jgi:hypothetical protein
MLIKIGHQVAQFVSEAMALRHDGYKAMMTNRRCPIPLAAKRELGRAIHAPTILPAAVAYLRYLASAESRAAPDSGIEASAMGARYRSVTTCRSMPGPSQATARHSPPPSCFINTSR